MKSKEYANILVLNETLKEILQAEGEWPKLEVQ